MNKKIKLTDRLLLIPIIFTVLFIVLQLPSFIDNVILYASGTIIGGVFQGQWQLFLLSTLLFTTFLIPLSFRKKASWKEKGVFSAFIVSLFIEMYGFPLSIFVASKYLFPGLNFETVARSFNVVLTLDFFGTKLLIDYWALFGYILVGIGALIISIGWYQLYFSKKTFENSGLYAISRNPQYVGFFFIVWGWTISWPSLLTLIMASVLTFAYHNASVKEEKLLEKEFGNTYLEYRKVTPMYA